MTDEVGAGTKAATVGVGLLVVFALVGGFLAYRQVPEGHEGVTKQWGAVNGETLEPGAHWKIPVMETVQDVEVRPRTYTMSATQGEGERARGDAITVKTVNGSSVQVDLTIRYRIDEERADAFVSEWRNERQMEQRLIRPTIRSTLRDEASDLQTTGDDAIYTRAGREALAQTAREALAKEFEDEPIVLEAVQVRNINLPDSIDESLDEKEQAKQQVEVEKERVKQERARAEQKRVQARAEADVIETRGEALQENPIVLEARRIEAYDDGTVFVTGETGQNIILDASGAQNATNATAGGN